MPQVRVDSPSFSLTVEKKQPVVIRTGAQGMRFSSHGEDGSIQFANGSTLGSHPSLAHDANTNITSIQILKSVDALLDTANITTANIGTLFATTMVVGSTEATGATFEDLSITNGLTVGKNITVTGNLTVEGTTTTVSSSTLDVADLNITVAKGAADSAAADGAGLTVDGASATFLYAHDGTKWVVNKPFSAAEANLTVSNTVTSYTTSSLVLPVGNDASRVSTQGGIRYSTAQSTFEGYDGSAWGSLGGVIDVDQDTYIKAELSDDNDILDFYTKGIRQAYISNTGLVSVTTKMTVPEANVTVANVTTLYVTSGATVPTPTETGHATTKAYVDAVSASVVGNTIELGAVPDGSWHDGAFLANNVTYDTNYLPTEGIEDNDNVTATLDTLNEVMHNVYRSSNVRHAKLQDLVYQDQQH